MTLLKPDYVARSGEKKLLQTNLINQKKKNSFTILPVHILLVYTRFTLQKYVVEDEIEFG